MARIMYNTIQYNIFISIKMGPRGARIMFVNVQSIQDSRGQVKIHKKSHKKSCAHEIIHLNNMHGTKHTIEFV